MSTDRMRWSVMLTIVAALAPGVAADEAIDVKVAARGVWPHTETTRATSGSGDLFWTIRSNADWAKATGGAGSTLSLARVLNVKEIDFAKEMVIAVRGANQPMVGYAIGPGQTAPPPPPSAPSRVLIERMEKLDGDVLRVLWKLEPRGKDEVLTAPVVVAIVPRANGEVAFEQLKGKDAPVAKGVEVKTAATALLPDGLPGDVMARGWVVRSADELVDPRIRAPSHVIEAMIQRQLALYAKALGVEKLTLGKQMIIGVAAGTQAGKRTVRIERIAIDAAGKVMTIRWKSVTTGGGEGLSNPAEVVLVDAFVGDVEFDPPIAPEGRKAQLRGRD